MTNWQKIKTPLGRKHHVKNSLFDKLHIYPSDPYLFVNWWELVLLTLEEPSSNQLKEAPNMSPFRHQTTL